MQDNYIIVFYSKGIERILHILHYIGRYYDAFEHGKDLIQNAIKDACYFDIFTEKEYTAKFE